MMRACEGDGCAAALLNFLIFHHDNKLVAQKQAFKYNDIAETHGDRRSQQESTYQWHTAKELEEGILGLYSARSIPKSLDRLVTLGFISIFQNPNKKYKFDRTKYFQVHPENIRIWLKADQEEREKAGALTEVTNGKNVRRSSEIVNGSSNNVSQSCISARAITMTTSMTPSNDQEEKDADEFFTIAPSSLNQENSFPVQTTPRIEETPTPPTPASPLSPENIGKAIAISKQAEAYKNFETRFTSPAKVNKKAPLGLLEEGFGDWHLGLNRNDWKPILIKAAIAHLRDNCKNTPHQEEHALRYINNLCGKRDWSNFEVLAKKALDLENAEAIATQQRQQPQSSVEPKSAPVIASPEFRKNLLAQYHADRRKKDAVIFQGVA
jgi:hypothetical protein